MKADLTRTAGREDAGPATGTETVLAEVLAEVIGVERVSVDSHFFDDLGADSMVMARFCARVRKRPDLPSVSMKDVYRHPTVGDLAAALDAVRAATNGSSTTSGDADGSVQGSVVAPELAVVPREAELAAPRPVLPRAASTPAYVLCGAAQFVLFVGFTCVGALALVRGYEWIAAATGPLDTYLRSVLFGGAALLTTSTLPIVAKWVLIGRWTSREIRIWSAAYVRFWIVKTLIRSSPMALFAGSPLYVLYLRALGARIGPGVAIFSRHAPVCADLLAIGEGTVIRREAYLTCYRAQAGVIQTGPVSLGRDVVVGDAAVLDIDTSMGDRAQLGHASSLHAGQAVPDGERWHGSPAQPTDVDYLAIEPAACGTVRRAAYGVAQVLGTLALRLPLAVGGVALLIGVFPELLPALVSSTSPRLTSAEFYGQALVTAAIVFLGAPLVGLLLAVTVPRVLNLALEPDKVYRLYGVHYAVHRTIGILSNRRFFTHLFGNTSWIVHYLRGLGYDLAPVKQTGANFGMEVAHENPFLCSVGTGTVVADGLSINNAEYSSTSFRVSRASIGRNCFLGNAIVYPSQSRAGDDCLLATDVMVPVDGSVRQGVGLLGSPSFEIPRTVQRDRGFDHLKSGDELQRRLSAKNRHNAVTMALYLLVGWIHLSVVMVIGWGAAGLYPSSGPLVFGLASVLTVLVSFAYFAFVERAVVGFRAFTPQLCSIYDPYFWWHERFWKVPVALDALVKLLDGTPFKGPMWRLLGARVGRRLFDDGTFISEKTLLTIGDDVTLNLASKLQCHSQEDDTFKSDRTTIGAGCTVGVRGWVHYGVTVGDGVVVEPRSFVMKGEEIPDHARWGGNPARELRDLALPEMTTTNGRAPDRLATTSPGRA